MIRAVFISLFTISGILTVSAQNSYEGDSLHKYILRQVNSTEVMGLVKYYTLTDQNIIDFGKGKMNKEKGVAILSTVEGVTRIILFGYNPETNEDGKKVFSYKLPLGVTWGMSEEEVKKKLEGMTINQSHRFVQIYYRPGVNFEYYFGTQNGKLRMVSVMVSWSKFDKGMVIYATERSMSKQATPQTQTKTQPVVGPQDLCGSIKSLIAEAQQNFSLQKKLKEWTTGTWQLENKIPGAIFTELKNGVYKVRVKDNLPQGPEANKAMDEWRNKITACLPGYIFKESSLSVFSDNPDEVMSYSWSVKYGQPYVELQREVTSYNKANIFIIIKPK